MMFKTLFFTFCLTLGIQVAGAHVHARWLTVASVLIDDGKTKLLFDPAWTRPGIKHWLNMEKFKSDELLVASILKKNDLTKIDAVFASHSHFDHVMDAPMVSKLAGAVFYTDESSDRLAMAYKEPRIRTIRMRANEKIRVGDFLITPIPREHAEILHLFYFLPGPVPADATLSFWDYHVGDTWFFLVEHPEGTILIDQGSEANLDKIKKHTVKVDVLIQGVANRRSDEAIIEGYSKSFLPKVFMPLHFDNFFADFNEGADTRLPGVNLEDVMGKMKKAYPAMKVDRPVYGKSVMVLESK